MRVVAQSLRFVPGSSFASQHFLHYYDGLPMDVDAFERVSKALWHLHLGCPSQFVVRFSKVLNVGAHQCCMLLRFQWFLVSYLLVARRFSVRIQVFALDINTQGHGVSEVLLFRCMGLLDLVI